MSHTSHCTLVVNAPLSKSTLSFITTYRPTVGVETDLSRAALTIGGTQNIVSDATIKWMGIGFETLATAALRLVVLHSAKAVGATKAIARISTARFLSVHLNASLCVFAVNVSLGTHARRMTSMGVRITDILWWTSAYIASRGLLANSTSVTDGLSTEVRFFTLDSRVTGESGLASANGLVILSDAHCVFTTGILARIFASILDAGKISFAVPMSQTPNWGTASLKVIGISDVQAWWTSTTSSMMGCHTYSIWTTTPQLAHVHTLEDTLLMNAHFAFRTVRIVLAEI